MTNIGRVASARITEIQGLRGIAVLAVVWFHARLPGMPGGFLGVDMFFVISGYVINTLLQRDITGGHFSFADFYRRRAWRLLPALFVTLLATAALFGLLMPASLNLTFVPALLSSAFGVSNLYFVGALDYFDSGIANPVLHTWSLGVEEQFYLAFPLLLLLLARAQRGGKLAGTPVLWLGGLTAVGLAAAIWATAHAPQAAFYAPWFRAWEFGVGALLVFRSRGVSNAGETPGALASAGLAVSLAGLAMLLLPLALYRETYLFPGIGALLPVLGTALLIDGAGRANVVNRWLCWRPLTTAGDMSYSLYLVHWPIVCLVGMFVPLTKPKFGALSVAISLAAGWVLWRFVEQTTRRGFRPSGNGWHAVRVPTAMGLSALLVYIAATAGEQVWASHPRALSYAQQARTDNRMFRAGTCFLTLKVSIRDYDVGHCLPRHEDRPALLILGDSLAANLALTIQERLPLVDVQQATAVDFKPGSDSSEAPEVTDALVRTVVEPLLAGPDRPDHVLLYARWEAKDLAPLAAYARSLTDRGVRVTVLGPSPRFYIGLPLILAYSEMTGQDLLPILQKKDWQDLDSDFAQALSGSVSYISMRELLCPIGAAGCTVHLNDELLFSDTVHFTPLGARYVVQKLRLPF